jgi:16S rRNA (uracil1498-N3)-methyltransferase
MSQRFYAGRDLPAPGESLVLNDEESHHLLKVMRFRVGSRVRLFFRGKEAWASIVAQEGRYARLHIEESINPPPPPKIRYHAIIPWLRGGKTDAIAQKLTEMGVQSICTFHARREVMQASKDKSAHLQKVVVEACKQCERADVPDLMDAGSVQEAFAARTFSSGPRIILHERQGVRLLGETLRQHSNEKEFPRDVACASGPEGGFDPLELEFGFEPPELVSLGPRILRAETAPIVAMAVTFAAGGEL